MSSPQQRIWARWDEVLAGPSRIDHVRAMTLEPTAAEPLVQVAERVRHGVPLRAAVADFMDDLTIRSVAPDEIAQWIVDEPARVDRRTDAFLGALAEHLAARNRLPTPQWALAPARFLDEFWWPTRFVALRAQAIVESPAAFRRRGIFIGATTLQRV